MIIYGGCTGGQMQLHVIPPPPPPPPPWRTISQSKFVKFEKLDTILLLEIQFELSRN
jgi:hypothetical protein